MADHENVVVYVAAEDARLIRGKGEDPALWVRQAVRGALAKERSQMDPKSKPIVASATKEQLDEIKFVHPEPVEESEPSGDTKAVKPTIPDVPSPDAFNPVVGKTKNVQTFFKDSPGKKKR